MRDIERNVPIPPVGKYEWERMRDGSAAVQPLNGEEPGVVQRRIVNAGRDWCARNRPEFRVVTRQEVGGVRYWLVKRKEEKS
jgi:hypothetical protein